MSKAQNKNGKKRRQRNMTPQKANDNTIEDLVDSEGEEPPVSEVRRMMMRMFNKLKEELKEDNSMNSKKTWIKI
jgi:hypothetical protein